MEEKKHLKLIAVDKEIWEKLTEIKYLKNFKRYNDVIKLLLKNFEEKWEK